MYVDFDLLPEESRVWVYQSERELTSSEEQVILDIGRDFIGQWASHGEPLTGSIKVFNAYFVVIAVDDRLLPSGCSIDASVGLMRQLCSMLNLDFFGRTNVPIWNREQITMVPLSVIRNQIKNGQISPDTLLVNTLVQQKRDLAEWVVPISSSWLSRYLPQPQG